MAEREINEQLQGVSTLQSNLVIGIAINGNSKSKYIIKWALDKFIPQGNVVFKLLHVRPRITSVPTPIMISVDSMLLPVGNFTPISQVREDVAAAYRKEVEWHTTELLIPYKRLITHRKVEADIVQLESDDVAKALAEEVNRTAITKLVVGAASPGMFSRKVKKHNLTAKISASTPVFCTVYAVSKGKLSSIRPSDVESNSSSKEDSSETSCSSNSLSNTSTLHREESINASNSHHHRTNSMPMQRLQCLYTINQNPVCLEVKTSLDAATYNHSRRESLMIEACHPYTNHSSTDSQSWFSDHKNRPSDYSYLEKHQVNFDFELEKLKVELRHVRGMYALAQTEANDTLRKLNSLNEKRLEEATKLKDIESKEREAEESAKHEKEKYEAAMKEVMYVKDCAEREAAHRRDAEMKALHDLKEKEKLESALLDNVRQCRMFSWDEIVSATASFSDSYKIGMGAYGTVYGCNLHHTNVAVKVLNAQGGHVAEQFRKELEILNKVRHPHLLLLIGACPDHSCLIYEFMENGSLEDRLLAKTESPPIPWFDRFRIAWEVASALTFLHNAKPNPIIHRDLKPANILLDHNYVSKIGDVGLATILQTDTKLDVVETVGPVGTMCYIDPEYQRTGRVSPESDVYALGMVILRLLTAKPAIALTDLVENAIEDGSLMEVLDKGAGSWPWEEAKELAVLGLRCAELRRRDRPELKGEILPRLERLKDVSASRARDSVSDIAKSSSPNHFICPILKEVMEDPCVAADGYSYERRAIERWVQKNDKSPITNLMLPHKHLIPNYTLLSAIMEWKSLGNNY